LIIKEEGFGNFRKEVRRFFKSRECADKWEAKLLRRINAKGHPDFYNKSNGCSRFVASGHVTVRVVATGEKIRVPVDDPYIGTLYRYNTEGRKMSKTLVDNLKRLYKGKWSGADNPVHKLKDDVEWVKSISERNTGRALPEHVKESLKNPSRWQHLQGYVPSDQVKDLMNFHRSINNSKCGSVYFYKGLVYLHIEELPVTVKTLGVTVVKEPHPHVGVLSAEGLKFPSIKAASKHFHCGANTLSRRIKKESEAWKDYFWLKKEDILKERVRLDSEFIEKLQLKYSDELEDNRKFEKPFSVGVTDEDFTKRCMSTGNFLEGSEFERLPIKSSNGAYSRYSFKCPLCSTDKYVQLEVCSGVFETNQSSLLAGKPPCRCGDPKVFSLEVYLQEIEEVCVGEGLTYLGVLDGSKGKAKETKIRYLCRKDNLIETARVTAFLNGNRCKCCVSENMKIGIPKRNLGFEFQLRKEYYIEGMKDL
jgi:hypothetical protein